MKKIVMIIENCKDCPLGYIDSNGYGIMCSIAERQDIPKWEGTLYPKDELYEKINMTQQNNWEKESCPNEGINDRCPLKDSQEIVGKNFSKLCETIKEIENGN